jgi:hypothetical protein
MPVNHVLILTEAPFTSRDYDRFGVELLLKNFQVSVLDCTSWLKPEYWTKYSKIAYRWAGYKEVRDLDSFVTSLETSANAIAIDFLGYCANSALARIELKKRQIARAVFVQGLLPRPKISWYQRLRSFFSSNTPRAALRKLARRGEQMIYPLPAPDVVMLSGSASLNDPRVERAAHRLWAHSLDYDVYLANEHREVDSGEPYAVFLDEDMAFHPDYDHSGIEPPTTPARYYPAMNRFFDRFEVANGMRVIVAAHPRSQYAVDPELWNGRTVILNQTASLVRSADCVLGHSTTSLSFAILWRKPILLLSTNDLNKSYLGPGIALRSSLLRQPLINVDECVNGVPNKKEVLAVDEAAYSSYVAEFIKLPGTPDLPAWQIFSEFVMRHFQ